MKADCNASGGECRPRVKSLDIPVQFLDKLMAVIVLPNATVPMLLVTCSPSSMLAEELQFLYGTLELARTETLVVTTVIWVTILRPAS